MDEIDEILSESEGLVPDDDDATEVLILGPGAPIDYFREIAEGDEAPPNVRADRGPERPSP